MRFGFRRQLPQYPVARTLLLLPIRQDVGELEGRAAAEGVPVVSMGFGAVVQTP